MSAEIVPRWEWRTFGPGFGSADDELSKLVSGDAQESEELYLLARDEANVKVRDGLMDVKLLRETDADGLERWEPVLKEGFPLSADRVGEVLKALGVANASVTRSAYELDQLLDELIRPSGVVREATIRKRRARFRIDGCTGELTDVSADGRSTRTAAMESEDAAAVVRAVRDLGLGSYVNTSYPRALTALLDDVPLRYAVIDVGTNSVKFHVGERDPNGSWNTIVDRAEVTRLGEQLDSTGTIGEGPLQRTLEACSDMVEEARRKGARAIVAVGTAAFRVASDRDHAIEVTRERTGVTVEQLSEIEESRLGYLAVTSAFGGATGSLVVFDTGGGSTEFTFGRGSDVDERFSLKVGAAPYTERFGLDRPVEPMRLREVLATISDDLSRLEDRPAPDILVGMGGAITNMTAVALELAEYDADRVQGAVLERAEVDRQIERYRSLDADARREIVGLQPKRAEVILAGACIVRTVMEKFGMSSLTVSDRGVRHGLLVDRFGA